uniref:pH regulation protein F n=1 Tax=Ignisphaera aggregans TaxID=334771 RepID=A0A7C5XGP6_9CREN
MLNYFLAGTIVVYVISALIYIVRLIRGPSTPDRVLALDALSFDLAVFLALLSLFLERPVLVFGIIPLVLWIHAVDIYVSKYLEAREMGE